MVGENTLLWFWRKVGAMNHSSLTSVLLPTRTAHFPSWREFRYVGLDVEDGSAVDSIETFGVHNTGGTVWRG